MWRAEGYYPYPQLCLSALHFQHATQYLTLLFNNNYSPQAKPGRYFLSEKQLKLLLLIKFQMHRLLAIFFSPFLGFALPDEKSVAEQKASKD